MEEMGGSTEVPEQKVNRRATYLDSRIVFMMIVCIAAGVAIILSFVFLGMRLGSEFWPLARTQTPVGDIEVASVSYSSTTFYYQPIVLSATSSNDDKEGSTAEERSDESSNDTASASSVRSSSILGALGAPNSDYAVISSRKKLDDLLLLISKNKLDDDTPDASFDADNDFFASGSVIAVSAEGDTLSDLVVDSISRDNNYNLTINASRLPSADSQDSLGVIVLIKVNNIQPSRVELSLR